MQAAWFILRQTVLVRSRVKHHRYGRRETFRLLFIEALIWMPPLEERIILDLSKLR